MLELFDRQCLICSCEPANNSIDNRLCAYLPHRALPYERYPPPLLSETRHVPLIPCNRIAKLAQPKFRSRCRRGCVSASPVSMPETTLNQDNGSSAGQHNVRRSRQPPVVQAKTQTASMKRSAEGHFRAGVFASDACHHARAGRGINDVNQFYPLAPFRRPGKATT
jgi:hypothetical protein